MRVLVTGSVGFIGYHLCSRLAADGHEVVGLDSFSDYYDISLKENRLARLLRLDGFRFYRADIADAHALEKVFVYGFDMVVHLAAQAGVRYSIENPTAYVQSNLVGFANILECCRKYDVKRLLFASSSSVYGETNGSCPNVEKDDTNRPVSLYAATKKADEVLAYSYSHLYGIKTVVMRLYTVYGEWGRPDMAYFKLADCLYQGEPFTLYNGGNDIRDFTYVGDVVESVSRLAAREDGARYEVYNIGCGNPVRTGAFLEELVCMFGERGLIKDGRCYTNIAGAQLGDVACTCADSVELEKAIGYKPHTPTQEGLSRFADWYKEYKTSR